MSAAMSNVVLVLGYNNTRVNDVRKIRAKSLEHLEARTVLCKKNPIEADYQAADFVINVGLEATEDNCTSVIDFLRENMLQPIALLPFSDPGTQLGAMLGHKFCLRAADPSRVEGGLNKHYFRMLEVAQANMPAKHRRILSWEVHSCDELTSLLSESGELFIKPAREGNSRGCKKIDHCSDAAATWAELAPYYDGGIVAEELIPEGDEYSWDHVNGFSWITEKKTWPGEYRSEIQEIVPANLSVEDAEAINQAGQFMADVVGNSDGACHNELFLLRNGETAAVEPNLRPAGGRIWDLAALAFEDFDPWREWIMWAAGKDSCRTKILKQKCYAGIRFIASPRSGELMSFDTLPSDIVGDFNDYKIVELNWTKKTGDEVSAVVRDGSEFVGYVIMTSDRWETLSQAMESTGSMLEQSIRVA